jgi:pSer/pThr/pTyr-binding forkhead associated (FHA) protein
MNYFVPEGQNYIILESLNSIKENQYPLSIHVLMYIENDEHFILGRGHESDVRISDISVSRSHAKISFKNKNFILEDTGSKFGTLVLAKDPVQIQDSPLILQVGRTLLSVCEFKGENEKTLFSELISKKSSGSSEQLNIDKFNLDKDENSNSNNNFEKLEDDMEEDLN